MSHRRIITLFGAAKEITAQQMLLTLNMNRVQNAVAVNTTQDLLNNTKTGENEVVIYKSPFGINTKFDWHRYWNKKETNYSTLILYTYENMRYNFGNERFLEQFCKMHNIDGCWDPNNTKEHNDKLLINLLKLYEL
jgi:hypothetical protein